MLSPKEPNLPYVIYELSLTNTQKLQIFYVSVQTQSLHWQAFMGFFVILNFVHTKISHLPLLTSTTHQTSQN